VHFILRFKRKSRKTINANKIIINKREARDDTREAKEIEIKAKKTKANTRASARANAKTITITTIIATIAIDKKQLLKLRKQFACTLVNLVLEIILILSSCLLLVNNLRKYTNNTLYS